ncbi:Gfo/Idh/MocA family oxidoreductase [uncultured Roseobacter sp.]|uniref:Gfo/Idh/MocA family protein n=1 Tax=uncultured Roseobacter sp. TaxID=114847 RepID=UPI002634E227|nr:Gfo/Idh/MocA family oxidoreductase [uncultured Roseobacter sp.]
MTDVRGRPFRWAILGTGSVARKFVLDLRQLGAEAEAHIVASRTPANAQSFASSLGVAHVAQSYAEAASADVDALYIATPPAQHEEHAMLGIAAGKAVLVEKPFARDAAAAERIMQAARAAGVFCMEAMWTRFQPLPGQIRDRIAAGDLGDIRGFDGSFMAANAPDPTSSLFDPARGGGALMDRGVYPLSLARYWLGPVTDAHATARIGDTGVDEDCTLMLRHASGALSTLRASLRAGGLDGAAIYGTKATLRIAGPAYRPTGAVLYRTHVGPAVTGPKGPRRLEGLRESAMGLRLSRGLAALRLRGERLGAPFSGNGYHYQARAVMQAVAAGRTEDPRMSLAESVEIMAMIDTARAGWSGEGTS